MRPPTFPGGAMAVVLTAMKLTIFGLVLLLFTAPVSAAIYRWTDAQGNIHFSDKPHPGAERVKNLPALESYSPPSLPTRHDSAKSDSSGQGSAAPPDHYHRLRLTSPQPKETFRSAERKVTVDVKPVPRLDPKRGDRLVYYLDGHRIAGPTTSTTVVLHNVDRGTHAVAAAIVNGDGDELIRSVPVTFYMKPPIANRNTPAFGG